MRSGSPSPPNNNHEVVNYNVEHGEERESRSFSIGTPNGILAKAIIITLRCPCAIPHLLKGDDGTPPAARYTAINYSGDDNSKDGDGNHSKGNDNSGKGNCNFVLLT